MTLQEFNATVKEFVSWAIFPGSLFIYGVKRYIDYKFKEREADHKVLLDKELEDHKASLLRIFEDVRFDFQRKMQDFVLLTTKRHSAYLELYELFHDLRQATRDYYFTRNLVDWSCYSDGEIKKILLRRHVPQEEVDGLISSQGNNRQNRNQAAHELTRQYLGEYSLEKNVEAHKVLNHLDLYLSDRVYNLSNNLLREMGHIFHYLAIFMDKPYFDSGERLAEYAVVEMRAQKALECIYSDLWEELKYAMQTELRAGDYSNGTAGNEFPK